MSMIKKGNFPQMSDQDQLAMAGASEEGKGCELFQIQLNPFTLNFQFKDQEYISFKKYHCHT